MTTHKQLVANRKNIKKANDSGKNRHFGKDNTSWKGGRKTRGYYTCPQCGKERMCEKRHANRICFDCHRKRGKKFDFNAWRKETYIKAKEWAIMYKGGKCKMCGVSDLPAFCYHFDHRIPEEKSYNVGRKFNQKINPEIIKELDKCDLLCANCHAIKTWGKNNENVIEIAANRSNYNYS